MRLSDLDPKLADNGMLRFDCPVCSRNGDDHRIRVPLAPIIGSENEADAALEVVIASSKPYGGGLVSLSRPVPLVDGLPLPYLGVDWQIKPSSAATEYDRCYELDSLVVWPPAPNDQTAIQNKYDGSAQINLAEGGMVQIDHPSWTDTGYKPGPLKAGEFTPVKLRYKFDYAAKTSSVVSVACGDDAPFPAPASLQGLAAQATNWARYVGGVPLPLLLLQIQLDDNTVPAGYSAEYRCNVYWSDQPIP